MKKLAATLLTAMAAAAVRLAIAPVADADVCAAGGGRHFSVGGCTNIAGDADRRGHSGGNTSRTFPARYRATR